jgi:hypothetical protein
MWLLAGVHRTVSVPYPSWFTLNGGRSGDLVTVLALVAVATSVVWFVRKYRNP